MYQSLLFTEGLAKGQPLWLPLLLCMPRLLVGQLSHGETEVAIDYVDDREQEVEKGIGEVG